ncbi:PQQ-binding-like beta-propeller repeat protein [Spiroplasma endosymbiont of Seladonia tumulorum]|uniref:outer membrane protein assembly factor BamB family protein n=1 Tax=Spiroplasma endosymbiont of Seladonia tumulorum TaxID=3066321 RepID=UPI0030D464CC
MKKLLSLLSLLTIGGTAVPTTIAASPYQKEETKLEISKVNYSQKNNLEKLNRVKRQDNKKNNIVGISEIVIITNKSIISSGVVLNNKLYFGSFDHNVYEYNPKTEQQKVVITTNGSILSSGVALNNKLYFGSEDNKVYEYNPETGQQKVVITTNGSILSSGVALNNKLYFGSEDNKVYEYNPETGQQKVVITTNGSILSSGVALNNKLYFGSKDNKVYEYDTLQLIESKIINMRDQVKRGLYLYHKKQNPNSEIKQILNINLKNLTESELVLEETQKNKSYNLEQDLNDICKDSNSTFINNSSIEQIQNTVSCSKQLTETNTFQKMNGFSKSETTSNTDNWSTNVNTKVTAKASSNAGVPVVFGAKLEVAVEAGGGYTWGKSKTYTITDTSNSSETEIKTTTNTTTITVPSQPVKVPPHSKISVYVTSLQNNIELILNYYQKIEGMVSAKLIDKNNNEIIVNISIKDAMLSLFENEILPSKIKINNDNSINFYYDIKSKKEIIMHQTEIGEAIPLNSEKKCNI